MTTSPKHTDTELLPCPFCGEQSALTRYVRDGRQAYCRSCGASACPTFHGPNDDTERRAITAWNTRASPTSDHNPLTVKDMRHSDVVERVGDGRIRDAAHALLRQWNAYRESDLSQMNAHDLLVRYELWNALDAALWDRPEASHHAELVEAGQQMLDDHQTSEQHHPKHVLVPLAAFEAMRDTLTKLGADK